VLEALATTGPSDDSLAALLASGDQPAFEALVRRHHRRVRSLCWRMTGSVDQADDLAQETFLRVHRYRDSYQPGRPFRVWLDRICMNVCLTHQERVKRLGPVVRLGETVAELPAHALPSGAERQDPEARAGMNELVTTVQNIMKTLPSPYRAVLVLRVFGGLSYQEIADVLSCSIGTVMSRLNRARAALRNRLKDREP
jgi:RNA polymerase sigma-70 factor (ECF subfamily)